MPIIPLLSCCSFPIAPRGQTEKDIHVIQKNYNMQVRRSSKKIARSRTSSIGDNSYSSYGNIDLINGTSNICNYMKNLLTRTEQIHNTDCKYYQGSTDKVKTIKSQHETSILIPPLSEEDEEIQHNHNMKQCECPRVPVIHVDEQHSTYFSQSQKANDYEDPGSFDESLSSSIDTPLSCFDDSQDLSTMCDMYQEKINQVKTILNEMHPEFENLEVDTRQFLPQNPDQNDQFSHRNESQNGEFIPKTRRTWWVEEYDSDQDC